MGSLARAAYTICAGAALLVAALVLPRSHSVDVVHGARSQRPDGLEAALLVAVVLVVGVLAVVGLTRAKPWLVAAAGVPGLLTSVAWLWYVVDLRLGNRDVRSCVHEFFCTEVLTVRPQAGAYVVVAAGLLVTLGGALAAVTARRAAAKPPVASRPTPGQSIG